MESEPSALQFSTSTDEGASAPPRREAAAFLEVPNNRGAKVHNAARHSYDDLSSGGWTDFHNVDTSGESSSDSCPADKRNGALARSKTLPSILVPNNKEGIRGAEVRLVDGGNRGRVRFGDDIAVEKGKRRRRRRVRQRGEDENFVLVGNARSADVNKHLMGNAMAVRPPERIVDQFLQDRSHGQFRTSRQLDRELVREALEIQRSQREMTSHDTDVVSHESFQSSGVPMETLRTSPGQEGLWLRGPCSCTSAYSPDVATQETTVPRRPQPRRTRSSGITTSGSSPRNTSALSVRQCTSGNPWRASALCAAL